MLYPTIKQKNYPTYWGKVPFLAISDSNAFESCDMSDADNLSFAEGMNLVFGAKFTFQKEGEDSIVAGWIKRKTKNGEPNV